MTKDEAIQKGLKLLEANPPTIEPHAHYPVTLIENDKPAWTIWFALVDGKWTAVAATDCHE